MEQELRRVDDEPRVLHHEGDLVAAHLPSAMVLDPGYVGTKVGRFRGQSCRNPGMLKLQILNKAIFAYNFSIFADN